MISKNSKTILEMVEKHGRGLSYVHQATHQDYKGCRYFLMDGKKVYLATKTQKELIEKFSQVVF